ncbi:MAG TPA: glycosyltransferase family 4 protein [Vicinamibacterales bacterium]|nr:glycosyltransferase family 4 protein [Vicinamibacterales bacterium]
MRPRVFQVLASLGYGDAIGQHALSTFRVLSDAGFDTDIFAETADPRLEHLTRDYRELPEVVRPDDVVIAQFSLGSRALRTAYAVPSRMILTYHNITPPEYFLGEHPGLVRQTFHGRRELRAYASRVSLALGVSEYNRRELEQLGFTPTDIQPLIADFSHLDATPDSRILDAFDDEAVNILFVGRLIPNKRPDQLIRYVHAYRLLSRRPARLLLAGSHAHFPDYRDELYALARRLGGDAHGVHILGQVSAAELTALYDVADVFLSASEHEGFCVPLMEAFYKRVPVIARAAAAVPDTMDGGGLLYDRDDPLEVAGLIDAVATDEALEARVLQAQDAALARLQATDFAGQTIAHVERVIAAPVRTSIPIAADFWRQFQLAEELDVIRETRPSAFQSLPPAADTAPVADVVDRR